MTNREILDLEEIPANLAVIGGGVIGLEMAAYFSSVGSHVTVVEMLDHIAGNTDRDISEILKKTYANEEALNLNSAAPSPPSATERSPLPKTAKRLRFPADKVLCSIAAAPVTTGFRP